MARPLRISYPGAFYHVTSRGNQERFLGYLATARQRYDARVHAYCLMDSYYCQSVLSIAPEAGQESARLEAAGGARVHPDYLRRGASR